MLQRSPRTERDVWAEPGVFCKRRMHTIYWLWNYQNRLYDIEKFDSIGDLGRDESKLL